MTPGTAATFGGATGIDGIPPFAAAGADCVAAAPATDPATGGDVPGGAAVNAPGAPGTGGAGTRAPGVPGAPGTPSGDGTAPARRPATSAPAVRCDQPAVDSCGGRRYFLHVHPDVEA